jgi:hypothetical protein
MPQQNIGNTSLTISANAQQAIDEFKRFQQEQERTTKAVNDGAQKVATGIQKTGLMMLGASTAAGAISKEIREVIQNIDKIPGVPAATVASIHEMKYALELSNRTVMQWTASAAGWVSKVGYAFGAMAYGADAAAEGMEKIQGRVRGIRCA